MDKLEKVQKAARQNLSDNLKSFRERHNISQEALSDRAGFHRTYVSQLERQVINPSLDTLAALAVALNVDLPALLSAHEGPPPTLKRGRPPSKKSG